MPFLRGRQTEKQLTLLKGGLYGSSAYNPGKGLVDANLETETVHETGLLLLGESGMVDPCASNVSRQRKGAPFPAFNT